MPPIPPVTTALSEPQVQAGAAPVRLPALPDELLHRIGRLCNDERDIGAMAWTCRGLRCAMSMYPWSRQDYPATVTHALAPRAQAPKHAEQWREMIRERRAYASPFADPQERWQNRVGSLERAKKPGRALANVPASLSDCSAQDLSLLAELLRATGQREEAGDYDSLAQSLRELPLAVLDCDAQKIGSFLCQDTSKAAIKYSLAEAWRTRSRAMGDEVDRAAAEQKFTHGCEVLITGLAARRDYRSLRSLLCPTIFPKRTIELVWAHLDAITLDDMKCVGEMGAQLVRVRSGVQEGGLMRARVFRLGVMVGEGTFVSPEPSIRLFPVPSSVSMRLEVPKHFTSPYVDKILRIYATSTFGRWPLQELALAPCIAGLKDVLALYSRSYMPDVVSRLMRNALRSGLLIPKIRDGVVDTAIIEAFIQYAGKLTFEFILQTLPSLVATGQYDDTGRSYHSLSARERLKLLDIVANLAALGALLPLGPQDVEAMNDTFSNFPKDLVRMRKTFTLLEGGGTAPARGDLSETEDQSPRRDRQAG